MRYLIATPEDRLADWQIRCVAHLAAAGARPAGIVVGAACGATRSAFWSLVEFFSRPRATRRTAAAVALPGIAVSRTAFGELAQQPVDFVLDFGSGLSPATFASARLGVWRLQFSPTPLGAPPGAGDIAEGRRVSMAALVRYDPANNVQSVLQRGALPVVRESLARHVDALLYEVARWPARTCSRSDAAGASTDAAASLEKANANERSFQGLK